MYGILSRPCSELRACACWEQLIVRTPYGPSGRAHSRGYQKKCRGQARRDKAVSGWQPRRQTVTRSSSSKSFGGTVSRTSSAMLLADEGNPLREKFFAGVSGMLCALMFYFVHEKWAGETLRLLRMNPTKNATNSSSRCTDDSSELLQSRGAWRAPGSQGPGKIRGNQAVVASLSGCGALVFVRCTHFPRSGAVAREPWGIQRVMRRNSLAPIRARPA